MQRRPLRNSVADVADVTGRWRERPEMEVVTLAGPDMLGGDHKQNLSLWIIL